MVRWNGRLSHFVLGFKKIQITLYTYVLAKIIQNGEDFIQKLTPGFKITWGILTTSGKQWKVQKRWNSMGYFCP